MTKRQAAQLDRLTTWLDTNGAADVPGIAQGLQMPREAATAMANIGLTETRLLRIGPHFFTRVWLLAVHQKLRATLGGRDFHPREMRETLGESRSRAELIAAALEAQGLLMKQAGAWSLNEAP